jgi:hypothetical protein
LESTAQYARYDHGDALGDALKAVRHVLNNWVWAIYHELVIHDYNHTKKYAQM